MRKLPRWTSVLALVLAPATLALAQSTYTVSQVTSDPTDHQWPSINDNGDIVWSQPVSSGLYHVFLLRHGSTTASEISVPDPNHNFRYPVIDNAGDIVYLKDGVGQGVQLAVVLNHAGTESIIEFSSSNPFSGAHRDAGQHFGISSGGTIISYHDFCDFGCTRTVDVSGTGALAPDFSGFDDFDINDSKAIVFSDGTQVYTAAVASPLSYTPVGTGQFPRINNAGDIILVSGAHVMVFLAPDYAKNVTVHTGLWADLNNNKGVVLEDFDKAGHRQIFSSTPCPVDKHFNLAFGLATGLGQEAVLATLTSPTSSLVNFANSCGFSMFNWQQQITGLPCGTGVRANAGTVLNVGNYCADRSLKSPPAFYDPPDGGYSYLGSFNPFPFVYDPSQYIGSHCTVELGGCPPFPFISNGRIMSFVDIPGDQSLSGEAPSATPTGRHIDFSTSLVGVTLDQSGTPVNITPLKTWTWNTTFNGSTTGGVSQTASIYPIIPGSGTGGVTITSVDGVPLTLIPPSQMVAVASGLAYSRVSQTFNGTVTLINRSSSAITAPTKGFFQILLTALPGGVTLLNASGTFNGSPYITVPAVTSLMPGQSATVNVQFKTSSGSSITFTPEIYSGSF